MSRSYFIAPMPMIGVPVFVVAIVAAAVLAVNLALVALALVMRPLATVVMFILYALLLAICGGVAWLLTLAAPWVGDGLANGVAVVVAGLGVLSVLVHLPALGDDLAAVEGRESDIVAALSEVSPVLASLAVLFGTVLVFALAAAAGVGVVSMLMIPHAWVTMGGVPLAVAWRLVPITALVAGGVCGLLALGWRARSTPVGAGWSLLGVPRYPW